MQEDHELYHQMMAVLEKAREDLGTLQHDTKTSYFNYEEQFCYHLSRFVMYCVHLSSGQIETITNNLAGDQT